MSSSRGLVTGEGLPESLLGKKVVEGDERGQGNSRLPHSHAGAGRSIEHPCGQPDDLAVPHFDIRDRLACTMLNTLKAQPSSEMRVPTVVNNAIHPDMGRMVARCSMHFASP